MSGDILEAKQRLPLPALMGLLGFGEQAKKSARCPFHDDKHNSFSIWQSDGVWFWKCHAGCGSGDEITFLEKHKGIMRGDAIKLFVEMAGVTRMFRNTSKPFDWQQCVSALKRGNLVTIGNQRWFSRAFCEWFHENKFIGRFRGDYAFPVKNNGAIVGGHYRVGEDWRYYPHGIKTAPFIIGDLAKAKQIHCGESPWDMAALADRTDWYKSENVAFIATRGAGNAKLVKGLIPQPTSVCAWPQNDQPGEKWLTELCAVCAADGVKVAQARVPTDFKDVNDWTKAGASPEAIYEAFWRNELLKPKPVPIAPTSKSAKPSAAKAKLQGREVILPTVEPGPETVNGPEVLCQSKASPRPLRVEAPETPMDFKPWQEVISANFPAYARPAEICASVIVQLLLNDVSNPFALALVDVPSSGKTITLNFFDVPHLAYTTDNFTPASFVSHASNVKREELANVDMLPRIRFRTLIVRDLAPIFGVKEDELLKTIGILTRALDGEGLETDSGVHGKRGYKGDWLFMLLAGTTPIPPRVFKVMGTLGSRLFFLALHSNTKSYDELIAQNRGTARREKEGICRKATDSILRTLWAANPSGVNWNKDGDSEDCLRVIARCAELLAALRGTIQMWQSEHDGSVSHSVPIIEQPDRINCLLYNLARGHALLCGRIQLATADLAPVLEVTFDSAPTIRSKVFRSLLEQNGTLKTGHVEKLLRCSKPTALKEMEALAVLGVAEKTEAEPEYGRPEHELRLAEKFQWSTTDECNGFRWLEKQAEGGNS